MLIFYADAINISELFKFGTVYEGLKGVLYVYALRMRPWKFNAMLWHFPSQTCNEKSQNYSLGS